MSFASSLHGDSRWRDAFFAVALVAALLAAYAPAWRGLPVWDDDAHITKAELRSAGGLARIWNEPGATQQYYPLVHSVFWGAYRLWGENPLGYHLLNLFLHAASCLLLVGILRRLEVPGAWLAAAIFALHPIEVESVAWISELKNALSGALYLGAARAYLEFDRGRRRGAYALAFGLFVLGLMAKSVIATLPAALLVIFWAKRGRLSGRRDVAPLIPFFVVGIAAGLFTAWMERTFIGASGSEFGFSLVERGLIAGRVFWFYLGKLLWPVDLMFIYPRWLPDARVWWQYLFPLAAGLVVVLAWTLRGRVRWPLAVVLLFGGTLFPALGFVNVYPFRYSFVADHFQYLAGLAPIAMAAACLAVATRRLGGWRKVIPAAISGLLILVLGALTVNQCRMYADYETLWRVTLAKNPACWLALNNLGTTRFLKGHPDEAIVFYERALAFKPDYAEAHFNLANVFSQKGDLPAAIHHLEQALALQPNYPEADLNLGVALARAGRLEEATGYFRAAVTRKADFPDAHYNLGIALYQTGKTNEAIAHFERALASRPDYAEAHRNLAVALGEKGRMAEAIPHYRRAAELRPDNSAVQNDLAWLLATGPGTESRDGAEAMTLAMRANELSGGRNPIYLRTLAAAYAGAGQFSSAINTAQRATGFATGNAALIEALASDVEFYRAGRPLRDPGFNPE